MDIVPPTLGARLRWLRELAGISARELDRVAGKKRCGHAATIETRLHDHVQLNTIGAYADALGVTVDWLRSGLGPAPSRECVRAAIEAARSHRSDVLEAEVA